MKTKVTILCSILLILGLSSLYFSHIYISTQTNIVFIIIAILFVLYSIVKTNHYNRIKNQMIPLLYRNIDILDKHTKEHEIKEIKKTIKLYNHCDLLRKTSNCDYVSFFKYDYNRRYVSFDFNFTIGDKELIEDTLLYNYGHNIFMLEVLNFDDELNSITIDDIKESNPNIYKAMKYKGTNKLYYRNIYLENKDNPCGFIALSFKDISKVLSESEKEEIIKLITSFKSC